MTLKFVISDITSKKNSIYYRKICFLSEFFVTLLSFRGIESRVRKA